MDHVLSIGVAIAVASSAVTLGHAISHTAGDPETPLLFYFLFLLFGNTKAHFFMICLNTGHFLYWVEEP
jgi:hypothetical protein